MADSDGSNPAGSNPGGSNPGGSNPAGSNPGGSVWRDENWDTDWGLDDREERPPVGRTPSSKGTEVQPSESIADELPVSDDLPGYEDLPGHAESGVSTRPVGSDRPQYGTQYGEDANAVDEPRRTIAINDGELGERLTGSGTAGDWRPAVSPNNLAAIDDAPDAPPAYLAVDLGITRLSAGIVSIDGEVLVRDRIATPQRSVWPAVTQLVHRVIAANKTELRPRWCGVTCPGPIDHQRGVMMPSNLPVWKDFPLRDELANLVRLPVAIDTHGRGLALAEQWLGQASQLPASQQKYATMVIADDVDGGLIDSGVLKQGKHNNLGGFGHICVEPDGIVCPCGGQGCLVMYASVGAIEADTGRDLPRTPSATIERSAIMVARAVASIGAMLDVAEFIVAGVVPQVFGSPFYDALDRELNDRSRLRHLEQLTVRAATGPTGPLVSAAAIARNSANNDAGNRGVGSGIQGGARVKVG